MAVTAASIRAGIASALSTIPGVIPPSGYLLSEPTPPTFEIELAGIEYDQTYVRGVNEWTFTVRGFVGTASDYAAQLTLDGWMATTGTSSVKAALESDQTLSGAVAALHVVRVSSPRTFAVAAMPNATFLGAEWTVRILAGP